MNQLAFRMIGDAAAPKTAYVLHGLLGNGRNWNSFITNLAASSSSNWKFLLIDLRGHGKSTSYPSSSSSSSSATPSPSHSSSAGSNTLSDCVDDLLHLAQETKTWPSALIGHSLGGKIIMRAALREQELYVQRTTSSSDSSTTSDRSFLLHAPGGSLRCFIIDSMLSGPGLDDSYHGDNKNNRTRVTIEANAAAATTTTTTTTTTTPLPASTTPMHHHHNDPEGVAKVLQMIHALPLPLPSRKHVRDLFSHAGFPDKLATWMSSNVVSDGTNGTGGRGSWAFNPQVASQLYSSHMSTNVWPFLVHGPPPNLDIDIIKATRSSRWKEPHAIEQEAIVRHMEDERQRRRRRIGGGGRGTSTQDTLSATTTAVEEGRGGEEELEKEGEGGIHHGLVRFHSVDGGHWLHTDNAKGLTDVLKEHFAK